MQYLLKYDGFLNDKADGYFGANTLAAVKAAQRHYGLVVDGICGPNTWEKIYYVVSRSNYASRTNVSLAAKYMLRCRYGYTVVDYHSSYYGPQTEGAVKDFQDKCGIRNQVVYGRVGRTTWMYLIGSDKDLNLGKSSSGGSGGSDSSSSGGGSGGDTNGYAATAAGMAEYAYSRIGDPLHTFYDINVIEKNSGYIPEWCDDFIKYCAIKVGYSPSGGIGSLTPQYGGTQAHRDYYIAKGFTANINDVQFNLTGSNSGHWGIIWSKTYTNITTIEANSSYNNRKDLAQKISYYWDTYTGTYRREDRIGNNYIRKFIKNY